MTPELRDLFARIQRLENDLLRRPVILASPVYGVAYRQLLIGGGNTLATIAGSDKKGLKRAATLTAVPTTIPTGIDTTYPDGLCAAYDLGTNPSSVAGTLVWATSASAVTVKNPAGGADVINTNSFDFQISEGSLVLCLGSFEVPCTAGGYATVYVPRIVGV